MTAPAPTTVVFYDGVCGLCNRLNQFLLRRDGRRAHPVCRAAESGGQAPPRDAWTRPLGSRHRLRHRGLETALRTRPRALAGRASCRGQLGGPWRALARIGGLVPRPLADLVYRAVARSRYTHLRPVPIAARSRRRNGGSASSISSTLTRDERDPPSGRPRGAAGHVADRAQPSLQSRPGAGPARRRAPGPPTTTRRCGSAWPTASRPTCWRRG